MRVLKSGVDLGTIKRLALSKALGLLGVLGALGLLQWVGVWTGSRLLVSGEAALLVYCWVAWNVAEFFWWTVGFGETTSVDCERPRPRGELVVLKTTKSCVQSMSGWLSAFCTTVAKRMGSAEEAEVLGVKMSKKSLKWSLGLIGVGCWGLLCAGMLMLGGAASAVLGVIGCWLIAEVLCWTWDRATEKSGAEWLNVGNVGGRVEGGVRAAKVVGVLPAIEELPERFQARMKGLVERAARLAEVPQSWGQELAGVDQREQLRRIFGELLPSVIAGFVKLNATATGEELRGEAEFIEVVAAVEERLVAFERHLEDRNRGLFFESKETLVEYLKLTAPAEVGRLGGV